MQSVSNDTFGPLVAYLVPGATVLAGLHPFVPVVRQWLAVRPDDAPTVGGFLFLTVAALAAGMTVSAVRWAVVEPVLRLSGVPGPPRDYSRLAETLDAVRYLHDIHYRHYLFYANMAVATVAAYASYRIAPGGPVGWPEVAAGGLEVILLAAARDTLVKLRTRTAQVLAPRRPVRGDGRPRERNVPVRSGG